MTTTKRLLLGVGVGFLLQVFAFALNVPEGQTPAAFALNASVLFFIPGAGALVAAFIPPVLWGAYYYLIPTFHSKRRALAVVVICLLHVAAAGWAAATDWHMMRRELREGSAILITGYCLVAVVAFCGLVLVSRSFIARHEPAA
jgi:hypothetical protein